jgi:hypothetical protein
MRARLGVPAAVLLCHAAPALAQLANHSIAVESGVSAPVSGGAGAGLALALSATAWIHGPLEAVVRVGKAAAPETAGRRPAAAVTGTAGLRASLLPDPLRPQLGLELGWVRVDGARAGADRMVLGVEAGLEWFPARDVALAARGALRSVGSALSLDLVLGAAAYF